MPPLLCDKCGKEITPGTKVIIIGPEADQRIVLSSGDMLVTHVECPTDEDEEVGMV